MRVVVEVPPAGLDELGVVINPKASTDASELVQAVQHLGALRGRGAIGTPQHTSRKLVNRVVEPLADLAVAGPIVVG